MNSIAFLILVCLLLVSAQISVLTNYSVGKFKHFYGDDNKTISHCNFTDEPTKVGLLGLVSFIAYNYLKDCVNVILYDAKFEEETKEMNFDLGTLFKKFPGDHVNGQISENQTFNIDFLIPQKNKCTHFLLFIPDLNWTHKIVGQQTVSRVVVVTLSTRWKIEEYLAGHDSKKIVNLLIVSHIWQQDIFFGLEERSAKIQDTNLYTHNLLTDAIGSNTVRFLTAWRCGRLTRRVNLFPPKMNKGFNGKQFVVAASQQPPFTFKKQLSLDEDSDESQLWDGVEVRVLRLLSEFLNYTIKIKEPKIMVSKRKGPSEAVIAEVVAGLAEIGSAGVYVTNERLTEVWLSAQHSTDCAAFITKASTALPRLRAILGPFQLSVWITLTLTYLIAIIPMTFADSHSLKPLLRNPWLIENMFWHVFGTFTNLFTFTDKKSWTKTKKNASRLLIGWYWAFSIIITACYTGSIVSFITLFVFPDVIDHVDQLVKQNFRIGTLGIDGWGTLFNNSEHEKTKWLLRDVELVPNTTQGLKNVSRSYYIPMFRPYAFLAGRAQMEYIVQANYTTESRKQKLHITKDCFVPFGVSFAFPTNAIYAEKFNEYILRIQQSGLMGKLMNEFKWEVERTSSGKLLQAGSGKPLREAIPLQRKLRLDDTQGMYLLLGAGFLIAFAALVGEKINAWIQKRKLQTTPAQASSFWSPRRFDCFGVRLQMGIRTFAEKIRGENYHDDYSEYDQSAYKKYDSRILRSRNPSKPIPGGSQTQWTEEEAPESEESHKGFATFKNVGDNEECQSDLIRNYSITSLPWEWGSNLYLRRNCDQNRLNTN